MHYTQISANGAEAKRFLTATDSVEMAVTQLKVAVEQERDKLQTCWVFTLGSHNRILSELADLRGVIDPDGNALIQELTHLLERLTATTFRSDKHKDHEGMNHIQDATELLQRVIDSPAQAAAQQQAHNEMRALWTWVETPETFSVDDYRQQSRFTL